MDFSSLKDQVANLSLYDLKAGVRKVQNAVMNYTEMEAKVREATNNEPWGASSSLMQEIANGTFNYQLLNEIMPMIYKRFTEKAAEEWRQIYKALQLLEFLIKNGSERVVDDARSHLTLLKMLRQFHFIDQAGKDQGVNVRNRSKELVDLLSDVEKIRSERKKSRSTRNKYAGHEGGVAMGIGSHISNSDKYGGFGSESGGGYGQYNGGVYGDGGGFGGQSEGTYEGTTQRRGESFQEYDEYDEGAVAAPGKRKQDAIASGSGSSSSPARRQPSVKKAEPPKPKAPEVDLFSFDDPAPALSAPPLPSNGKQPAMSADFGADDDEFDDFQSATPSTAAPPALPAPSMSAFIPPPASTSTTTSATQFAAPQPRSGTQGAQVSDLFASISPPPASSTPSNTTSFSPPAAQPFKPSGYQPSGPNYFTSVPLAASPAINTAPGSVLSPAAKASPAFGAQGKKPAAGGDPFGGLLAGTGIGKKNAPQQQGKLTMADLAKQKAQAGIWGAPTAPAGGAAPAQGGRVTGSSGLDDLLG